MLLPNYFKRNFAVLATNKPLIFKIIAWNGSIIHCNMCPKDFMFHIIGGFCKPRFTSLLHYCST